MTFIEYCEKANDGPLSDLQKDYISKFQTAIVEGTLFQMDRISISCLMVLYRRWLEKEKENE